METSGKIALVTGGASGIGAALARELAARGAKVIVADIDLSTAQDVASSIGESAAAIAFDAASPVSIEDMAAQVWTDFGPMDLVFANAGVSVATPLLEATEDEFNWQFNVNVRGVWAMAKSFLNRSIAEGRAGHLIITASEHALGLQHIGAGVYTGTKHAVLGLAEMLRAETPENIDVSVFCPGLVRTRLHHGDRFGVVPSPSDDMKAIGEAISKKGMTAKWVAERALDAVERGDFYIFSHPTSFMAAERRFSEIRDAFAKQAPMTEEAARYDVNAIIESVLADLGNND